MTTLTPEDQAFIEKAKHYAIECHASTNHQYDHNPYSHHLQLVYNYGIKYAHLLPANIVKFALAACWTHDTIEDTRQTYNDVKKALGEGVAIISFALTNEKGINRKQRANNKYYAGIKAVPGATFVKICDRLANAAYSSQNKSGMFAAYQRDNDDFDRTLYTNEFKEMFVDLAAILKVTRPVPSVYGKSDKTNMEFLEEAIIASGATNADEMQEWLDAIVEDQDDAIHKKDDEINELQEEVKELEDRDFADEDDDEEITDTVIQAGIGQIKYSTPGNLVLDTLMETLNDKIQSAGPQKILDLLNAL